MPFFKPHVWFNFRPCVAGQPFAFHMGFSELEVVLTERARAARLTKLFLKTKACFNALETALARLRLGKASLLNIGHFLIQSLLNNSRI